MSSRRLRAFAFAASLSSFALAAPSVMAQPQPSASDVAAARSLGQDGQAALDKKDFKTAEDRFSRAWKLYPQALSLGVGYARALTGNGKLVAAQEAYNKVIRANAQGNKVFEQAQDDANKELATLAPRIAGVTINVTAAGGGDLPNLKVTLDDALVNSATLGVKTPVDPGAHVVKATADGFKPGEAKFAVNEGGAGTATITLEKDASAVATPPTPPTGTTPPATGTTPPATGTTPPGGDTGPTPPSSGGNKTLMWVAFGVGGAGLAAGAITGILAMGKKSDLDKVCTNGTCPASSQSDIDSYHTMGLLSTIGFAVGVVGAGAGVYFLLTQPKDAPTTAGIRPYIGPGSFGAVGRF